MNIFIFNLRRRKTKLLAAAGPHIDLRKGIYKSTGFSKLSIEVSFSNTSTDLFVIVYEEKKFRVKQ